MFKWPKKIETDTADIHILAEAALSIKDVEGLVIEIGTRLGGGILHIIENCLKNDDKRFFLGVDPYGDILYKHGEFSCGPKSLVERCSFNSSMMSAYLSEIYSFCWENDIYFQHFILEDTEFFRIYKDGVILYADEKLIINKYALVHIDGPHNLESVIEDAKFFLDKVSVGGYVIFDDVVDYKHEIVHELMVNNNFVETLTSNRKIAYKKIN